MKKFAFVAILVLVFAAATFSPVSADAGGAPGAHGVSGQEFGAAVSGLAQSAPGAVAAHVSSAGGNGGGMPAAHGVSGKDFGAAVSNLAKMAPGAVASHVSGK